MGNFGESNSEAILVQDALDALYRELRTFHPRSQAHLVTRNLQLSNILVTYDRGVAEFSGLIDFHGALLAPGEIDFGLLFWSDAIEGSEPMISAFYDGYGMARTMDVKRREAVYRKIAAVRVVDQSLMSNAGGASISEWERRILERGISWLRST
jgi:aminoglycoside/choline kinase family phosphotransferase